MRKPTLFLSILLALFTTVIASPHPNDHDDDHEDNHRQRHGCLNDHDANTLLHRWISFFEKLDPALAANSVTDDFHLFSESTNAITPNRPPPISTPQYATKAAFIAGQTASTAQGPPAVFDVVATDHGCDSFTFRWSLRMDPTPVAGIDLVFVQKGTFLIEKAYSEFNNLVLLANAGCKVVGGACGLGECAGACLK